MVVYNRDSSGNWVSSSTGQSASSLGYGGNGSTKTSTPTTTDTTQKNSSSNTTTAKVSIPSGITAADISSAKVSGTGSGTVQWASSLGGGTTTYSNGKVTSTTRTSGATPGSSNQSSVSGNDGTVTVEKSNLGTVTPSNLSTDTQTTVLKDAKGNTIATVQPVYISGAGTSTTYRYTTTSGNSYQFGLGGFVTLKEAAEYYLDKAKKALYAGNTKEYEENTGNANLFTLAAAYEDETNIRNTYGAATGITYDASTSMIYDGNVSGTNGQSVLLKSGEKAPTGTITLGNKADSWKVGDVDGEHTAVNTLGEKTVSSLLTKPSKETKVINPGEAGSPQNPILSGYEGYVLQNPSGTTVDGIGVPNEVLVKAGSDTVEKYINWTENSLGVDENGNIVVNDGLALAVSLVTPDALVKVIKRTADGRSEELDAGDYAFAALDAVGLIPGIGWAVKGIGKVTGIGLKAAGKVAGNVATNKNVLKVAGNAGEKLGVNAETSLIKLGSNAEEGLTKLGAKIGDKTSNIAKTTKALAPVTTAVSVGGQAAVIGYYLTQDDGDSDTPTTNPDKSGDTTLPESPFGVTNYYVIGGSDSAIGGSGSGGSSGSGDSSRSGDSSGEGGSSRSGNGGGVVQTTSSEISDLFATYGPYIIPVLLVVVGLILLLKKNKTSKRKGVSA